MGFLIADLKAALRHLRQSPGFAVSAIGTLALGIGATTAIFSTLNAALLRPLPYPAPGELYGLRTTLTDGRPTTGLLSPVEIIRLNDPQLSIARAAGMIEQDVTLLRNDGTPLKIKAYGVSEGFFEIFGLPMTLGGLPSSAFSASGPPGVVISHRIWRDMYGNDPQVIGKPIRFAEISTSVIAVAHPDFDTPRAADLWFAFALDPKGVNHSFEGFMRVKPGANIERVKDEMSGVMAGVTRDFQASNASRIYVVKPLVEQIVGDLSTILVVVLSATALLLVLACVNVTNLLLARGSSRLREVAVRVALGASRGRILRQLLTESAVLAAVGALAGLAVASAGVRFMMAAGASRLPRLDAIDFDGRVLTFALFTTVICGLVVGLAPAIRLAGADLRTLMNESSRSASGGRGTARWLQGLMVAEIALAVILAAGAGWLIRGFDNLRSVNLGFAPENRLTFDATFLLGARYKSPQEVDNAVQDLLRRLRAIPGVTAASTTSNLPLKTGQENSLYVELLGQPMDPLNPLGSRQRFVGPGYFDAIGTPMVSGRDFSHSDLMGTQPVVIVNQTFARRYLNGRDPIGVQFSSGYPDINRNNVLTVIGVVSDVRQRAVGVEGEPAYYSSDRQAPIPQRSFVLHTRGTDSTSIQAAIRSEVRTTDPLLAIEVQSLSALVASTWERQEMGMTLMLVFGGVAVLLAAVGIYGVIAYATAQRRIEVATRLALGASPGDVFRLMLRQGRTLSLAGAAIGLGLAYLAGRVVASRLYEVRASDPWILGLATLLMAVIAAVAIAIPAFRASRIDPVEVLRPQ